MSIATKKGDGGETSLYSGERVKKYDLRVEAYGTCDELISFLGLLKNSYSDFYDEIELIQNTLYRINSYLATTRENERFLIEEKDLSKIEELLNSFENEVGELKGFVVPSECYEASIADICRTICRRFERRVVELSVHENVDKIVLRFINRLSDLLFMMARVIGKRKGGKIHGFKRDDQ
ncbi:cob(I)yrinic acid a,c-diamide adenosyltransferase [Calditerrivibrio nitroreducens]|uniref:Corrinoid adenosyltransferase n=1 Tax=Calditerrivibrio nitroreducens (strain DSM 19672 / NBRC 101217 / Yu37-1) TaxID=768670 RepID=E4TIZ1_CALNY|nr:cob(I)yrinic acid a,c-diamide adenosyltransferase [Calditerrivibrio nitroreducens]ADR19123.1 ATP/cobalamin adenosyltransferase [Calditerrivibrio nitroreducens DSM 19672]